MEIFILQSLQEGVLKGDYNVVGGINLQCLQRTARVEVTSMWLTLVGIHL